MRKEGNSAEAQLGLPEYRGHGYVEKIAFALLGLFILAAMAGVFGDGPLSNGVVTSQDGQLRVEYQRFCRRDAHQMMEVTLPTQPGGKQVEFTLSSEYLQRVQVTEIFPPPLESTSQNGTLRFAADGSGKPMTVRLHMKPQFSGWQQAHITAANHGSVHFKQLVYP